MGNYSRRRTSKSFADLQRQDEANKRLNLALGMGEKVQSQAEVITRWNDFEVHDTKEVAPVYNQMIAPTINPPRPRALKIAYSKEAEKLVVRFRDGTWWEYNEIPIEMWNGLKASDSTGRYLKHSGLDEHDNMGPFNPDEMPEEVRVMFNS